MPPGACGGGMVGDVRVWAIAVDGPYVIAITPDSAIAPTLRPTLWGRSAWGFRLRSPEPVLIIFTSFPYPGGYIIFRSPLITGTAASQRIISYSFNLLSSLFGAICRRTTPIDLGGKFLFNYLHLPPPLLPVDYNLPFIAPCP